MIATLEVGASPTGVSFSPDGKLALVANRGEGTVSILIVNGKILTPAGKIELGDAKSAPCHVAFLPDGKRALVTRDGDHRISVLSVDGSKVEDTKAYMVGGIRPYSISISPKGDLAVLTNQGGGQGDTDIISVIDLKKTPLESWSRTRSDRSPKVPPSPRRLARGGHDPERLEQTEDPPVLQRSWRRHGLSCRGRQAQTRGRAKVEAGLKGGLEQDGKTLLAQSCSTRRSTC
jgi:hypothetical protein